MFFLPIHSRSKVKRRVVIVDHELDRIDENPSSDPETPSFDIDEPPDGGCEAWAQVLVCFLCIFNSFGPINSFGVFQHHYQETLKRSHSEVSWIGALQLFLLYFLGSFSGRALDAGYYRSILAVGLVLQLLAFFVTSFSNDYWQILLFQGLCQGLGNGCLLVPSIANTSTYFRKLLIIAIGIAACGGGVGGIVFPIVARASLGPVGFAWTLRIMGFVVLFNAIIILSFARTRLPSRTTGPLIEWRAFKEAPYTLYCMSMFFGFIGEWIAYFYVRAYAHSILHVTKPTSFTLIFLINGAGILGRLVPAYLADTVLGPLNTFIPFMLFAGVVTFAWTAVESTSGMLAFTAFCGFFAGGIQMLVGGCLASLNAEEGKAGTRIGMGFSIVGVASLLGTPLGGILIELDGGKFLYTQIFAGSVLVTGAVILISARIAKTGWSLAVKV